ncbi:RPA-related protein RADX isoform X2 [Latimeria chalumnae]|uniref:RPA-related protein RADX isoform X2 n=1 Tax=Latimeria chalumnae TaxID=7897 RepID=UPI00313CCF30
MIRSKMAAPGDPGPFAFAGAEEQLLPGPLYVVAVERYLRDPSSWLLLPPPPAQAAEAALYDVTLTDGARRLRGTLQPRLAPLVRRGELACGSRLRRARLSPQVDEGRMGGGCGAFFIHWLEGPQGPLGEEEAPGSTPVGASRSAPSGALGSTSVGAPRSAPSGALGSTPSGALGSTPVGAPRSAPSGALGSTPAGDPGSTSSGLPRSAAPRTPGSAPAEDPGSAASSGALPPAPAAAPGPVPIPPLQGVNLEELPWLQHGQRVNAEGGPDHEPLAAKRRCYLPLWCDDDCCYGEAWPASEGSRGRTRGPWESVLTLRQLEESLERGKKAQKKPVIVRIVSKFRVHHFGKAEKKSECPYQGQFVVADRSSNVLMVLWNSQCLKWYRRLEVGMVLQLQDYNVKENFLVRIGDNSHQPEIELDVNSRNPATQITVIQPQDVKADWQLPDVRYNFVTRAELSALSTGGRCDVIGLVMFVGRPERLRRKGTQLFSVYRWVHMIDGTEERPFVLQLFSTSQPEIHANLHPMTYFVCTNARLVHSDLDSSGSARFWYLVSTRESQIYITGHHSGKPYVSNLKVKQFIQWVKHLQEKEVEEKTVIGGYYAYPPLPTSKEEYLRQYQGECLLTSMEELRVAISDLPYRESRRFTIQGTVITLRYVPAAAGRSETESPGTPLRRSRLEPEPEPEPEQTALELSPVIPVISFSEKAPRKRRHKAVLRRKRARFKGMVFDESPVRPEKTVGEPGNTADPQDSASSFTFLMASQEFQRDSEQEFPAAPASDTETSVPSELCWASRPWPGERIAQEGLLQETLPRHFRYSSKDFLVQACGLQPSRFKDVFWDPEGRLDRFAPATYRGHYLLTVLGLNEGLAVDAVFLPIVPGQDHRWPGSGEHENSLASILAHGGLSPPGRDQIASKTLPSPGEIVGMAKHLENQRCLFVLDACNHGSGRREIVLNRAYPL